MRIAMISTAFLPVPPRDYGGTELVIFELVEGLIDRGHEVTLFATGDSHTRARQEWLYPVAQWPPNQWTDLNHTSWAMGRAAEGGFDVIHAHSAAALALWRLLPRTPLVYTLHHVEENELSAYYRHFPEVRFVAISNDQFRREPGISRGVVIHHGLDPRQYRWSSHRGAYVCFLGRFSRIKGPHIAIDAAAMAGVPIRLAGDVHHEDRGYFQNEVEPRFRSPHVSYLGPVGLPEKARLLRDARALLAPIGWNEPFGLILIEAMLAGCPVVAFPHGSAEELIEPGVTGFLAGSLQEMAHLIRPGGPIERLPRGAVRARAVERFSRERMVAEYERLFYTVQMDSGRTRPRPMPAA